ncbi:hypothetical protein [Streptomyces litmocidini]|uniref:hypothetical protein n=1 Tax=Streptomyces litmocidini TaxID=67318 RepID=UPI003701F878
MTTTDTAPAMTPDPLERLSAVLIQRLGGAWIPATRPGEQLPAEPGDTAAEEALATQASELAEKSTASVAQLIRRQPVRAAARELYRLAAQLVEMADAVDDRRGC